MDGPLTKHVTVHFQPFPISGGKYLHMINCNVFFFKIKSSIRKKMGMARSRTGEGQRKNSFC